MSLLSAPDEHRLTGRIYAAALEPAQWPSVLEEVVAASGGCSACMFGLDMLDPSYNYFVPCGVPLESLQEYREKGFDQIEYEVHRELMAPYVPGLAIAGHQAAGSQADYRRRLGTLYQDFYRKYGVEYLVGAILDAGDFRWSVLGLHRTEAQGEFTADTLRGITRLATHIARATQVQRQLLASRRASEPLYELLDAMGTGVLLLDGEAAW